MTEDMLITGLADLESQLKAGNVNAEKLIAQVRDLSSAIQAQRPPEVQVTVQPAPVPSTDWEHVHYYDGMGRCIRTTSTRKA